MPIDFLTRRLGRREIKDHQQHYKNDQSILEIVGTLISSEYEVISDGHIFMLLDFFVEQVIRSLNLVLVSIPKIRTNQ